MIIKSLMNSLFPPINTIEYVGGSRLCRSCGENKLLESFDRKPGGKDGVDSRCKVCISNRKRQSRLNIKAKALFTETKCKQKPMLVKAIKIRPATNGRHPTISQEIVRQLIGAAHE